MFRGSILVLVSALTAGSLTAAGQGAQAEGSRLDVSLTVLVDGSVEVEERHDIQFGATAESSFMRREPVWRHDGVFAVSAAMDGQELSIGNAVGQVSVGRGPSLDVTWRFPPTANSRHVFALKYRAAGAVEVSGIRGTLDWRILSPPHRYGLSPVCVSIVLPTGAVVLDNPGFEEAGGNPGAPRPDGSVPWCGVVSDAGTLTRNTTFTIDTMAVGEPTWQYYERRTEDLMPAFVSSGIFLLVIGAGIVWMVRMKYPPPQPGDISSEIALTPVVEQALTKPRYPRDVLPSLVAAGLVDFERMYVARDLRRAAIATLVFGVLAWTGAAIALNRFGRWPLAIPAGFILSAMMLLFEGWRMPILSQTGVNARERVLYSARVRAGRTRA
jgi:hypothetical protein